MDRFGRADLPLNPWGDGRRGRIGLLGGSFNPAHDGHRHVAETALRRFALDEVWLLVSPQNPLKAREGMAPQEQRLAWTRQILGGHPRLRACDIERTLRTRYTADTVRQLRRRFPRVHFVWVMGADNLEQIHRWERWAEIFACVPVAILARAPYSQRALAAKAALRLRRYRVTADRAPVLATCPPPAWMFLPIRLHPASATAIRARETWDAHAGVDNQ